MRLFSPLFRVAALGGTLIAVPTVEAHAEDGAKKSISDLALPVDREVSYYNPATATAAVERCENTGSNVLCTVRILSNSTRLDYTRKDLYRLDNSGTIQLSSNVTQPHEWTPDTHTYDYTGAITDASKITWDQSSRMAQPVKLISGEIAILQNNILGISATGGDVEGCSVMPVSDIRAFKVCYAFNQGSGTVESSTAVILMQGNELSKLSASRPYNYANYDDMHHKNLNRHVAAGRTAYIQRNP